MRVAVIGSRNAKAEHYELLKKYIPINATEIVSGGATGIDTFAKKYANENNLILTEFLPNYSDDTILNKKMAPLMRNQKIVDYCDILYAFWDGKSRGTAHTLDYAYKNSKPAKVILIK